MNKRYALLPDKPTFHLPHVEGNVQVAAESDLWHLFPPIISQGDIGDCTEASGTALRYALAQKAGVKGVPIFDPIAPYVWERQQDGTYPTDAGSRLSTTAVVAQQKGFPPQTKPYSTQNYNTLPGADVVASAEPWKIKSAKRITSLQGILETLSEGVPVHIGVLIYESFEYETTLRSGIVPMPRPGEHCLGGHAMVLGAHNLAQQWADSRNSWGSDVGMNGIFRFPFDYFRSSDTWMSAWRWEV